MLGKGYHIPANFDSNVMGLSACNTIYVHKFCKLCRAVFSIYLQHLRTKLCNFSSFNIALSTVAVLIDFAKNGLLLHQISLKNHSK